MTFLIVGVGTAIGAVLRFLIMDSTKNVQTIFPWSTFLINLSACFLVGLLSSHLLIGWISNVGIIGIAGGLSTFSTYANEGSILWRNEKRIIAISYIVGSVIAGIIVAAIGFYI